MTRLGVIGKPSDWLIASKVDYSKAKSIFNIELFDIEISELIDIYNSKISAKLDSFTILAHKNTFKQSEIDKAYLLYLSINPPKTFCVLTSIFHSFLSNIFVFLLNRISSIIPC